VVPGGEIPPGSTVTTAGASRVSLRLESGHSVRLDAESSVHLLADGRLALDRGAVYVDSDGAPEGEAPVVVSTPLGRVREIGTRFEVRLEAEALRVRLRDGAVVVRADGAEHEVAAGEELLVSELDGVHRTTISPHDPAWAWTASIAPILPLEGRPAREFLEWYARERGLRLAFSDAEIAASTSDIELSGSARGLELDEALQVVLRTSRLRHRVEDGVLWIDRLR
jgi:transmembrane sensor